MTHASVELIEAMLGHCPPVSETSPSACGAQIERGWPVWASKTSSKNWGSQPDSDRRQRDDREVDCPRCLVLEDAAREGRAM